MNTVIHTPQISLFSEQEEPQNYEIYIYGTGDFNKLHHDSFGLALDRYLREINISQKMLSRLTGIAPSTISRYLSGKRNIRYDYLCAVCIALKLHPSRQRHLFTLMRYAMPCETSISRQIRSWRLSRDKIPSFLKSTIHRRKRSRKCSQKQPTMTLY